MPKQRAVASGNPGKPAQWPALHHWGLLGMLNGAGAQTFGRKALALIQNMNQLVPRLHRGTLNAAVRRGAFLDGLFRS